MEPCVDLPVHHSLPARFEWKMTHVSHPAYKLRRVKRIASVLREAFEDFSHIMEWESRNS